jgi:hypothetical protein
MVLQNTRRATCPSTSVPCKTLSPSSLNHRSQGAMPLPPIHLQRCLQSQISRERRTHTSMSHGCRKEHTQPYGCLIPTRSTCVLALLSIGNLLKLRIHDCCRVVSARAGGAHVQRECEQNAARAGSPSMIISLELRETNACDECLFVASDHTA